MAQLDPKTKKETLTLVIIFVLVLAVSALVVYMVAAKKAQNEAVRTPPTAAAAPEARPTTPNSGLAGTPFEGLFGGSGTAANPIRTESLGEAAATITVRLVLAALLGAALAFRPRRRMRLIKRNPFVGQTQILLAVVAAALMIIVGDNAARAFGIFAAVSVVRFRTNIRDPKEITVLLISLAVGLGAGVGRWELALILTVFSLLVLWILEQREAQDVSRAMDLTVTTRDVAATKTVLRKVLSGHGFDSEMRGINRETSDDPLGTLTYLVDVSPVVTTDAISSEILALDPANVAGIEWKQQKSNSYMYQ